MLDFANQRDIPALISLWESCFYDTKGYIEHYFNSLFYKIRIPIFRLTDGRPVSMLSMLPVTLKLGQEHFKGHYIYAAATVKEEEGKGHMSALIDFACEAAKSAGEVFSCLIPATSPLFDYYQKRGYQTAFERTIRVSTELDQQKAPAVPMKFSQFSSVEAFIETRIRFVENLDHVLLQDNILYPYIVDELLGSGAALCKIMEEDGSEGYAVCFSDEENQFVAVKETSVPAERFDALAAAVKEQFGCHEVVAAFPPSGQVSKPYGMIRFLGAHEHSLMQSAYMGLLMD